MCVSGLRWGITTDTVCNEGVVLGDTGNFPVHNQPPADTVNAVIVAW